MVALLGTLLFIGVLGAGVSLIACIVSYISSNYFGYLKSAIAFCLFALLVSVVNLASKHVI